MCIVSWKKKKRKKIFQINSTNIFSIVLRYCSVIWLVPNQFWIYSIRPLEKIDIKKNPELLHNLSFSFMARSRQVDSSDFAKVFAYLMFCLRSFFLDWKKVCFSFLTCVIHVHFYKYCTSPYHFIITEYTNSLSHLPWSLFYLLFWPLIIFILYWFYWTNIT